MSEPASPRLLVTGAAGQVGTHLVAAARAASVPVVGLDRAALDITDLDAVRRSLDAHGPDVVVNAAAYTAVDRAEAEAEAAFAVNRDGAATLAQACTETGASLVHLSTDYVFDGRADAPYAETDAANPLNVYGASKAAGEAAVRETLERHAILRTAWVFSTQPPNFVRTILRLAQERDVLDVVADQYGHPTWAGDIAQACLVAARRLASEVVGTVHVAGAPLASWHDLAVAVVEAAADAARVREVRPVPTSAFPRPAVRPARVELDLAQAREKLGLEPADWRPRVGAVVRQALRGDHGEGGALALPYAPPAAGGLGDPR